MQKEEYTHEKNKKKRKLLQQAINDFEHLYPWEIVILIQAYETWLYEKQYKAAMEDLYSDGQTETISEQDESYYKKAMRFISTPKYELAMNVITIANIFTVFFRALQQQSTEGQIHTWIMIELTINFIMLFEMVGDILISGPIKAYMYHFRIWPETLCQMLNIPALIYFIKSEGNFQQYNYTVKVCEVIVFIRMIKLLTLLYEIKTMRVIFETIKNLLGPLNNLLLVMLTIFYVFAQLAMIMFGGLIKEDSTEIIHDSSIPDNYYLMNFNDLMSSFVTLFVLIVVNNWFVIVAMVVDVKAGNTYYRYFFVVFYYFGVIIGLNIIVAFAIDMYAAVSRLEDQKEQNKEYLLQLAQKQHGNFVNKNKVSDSASNKDKDKGS